MADVKFIVQTADKTRKAEVTVPDSRTFGDVIEATIKNWALPTGEDINYKIVIVSRDPHEMFANATTLATAGVKQEEILVLDSRAFGD